MIKSFQIGLWPDFRRRRWRKVLYRNLSAFTRAGSSDKMVINKKTRLEKFPRNTGSRLTSWQNIDKIHWKVKALLENREPPKRQFFFLVTVFVFLYRIQRFFKVINNITNNDKFWQKASHLPTMPTLNLDSQLLYSIQGILKIKCSSLINLIFKVSLVGRCHFIVLTVHANILLHYLVLG